MAAKYNVRLQYAAAIAVATLGTSVVLTTSHFFRDLRDYDSNLKRIADLSAQSVARTVKPALIAKDRTSLPGLVANATIDPEVLYLKITDAEGTIVYPPSTKVDPTALYRLKEPVLETQNTPDGRVVSNVLGTVELGLAPAALSAGVVGTVLLDLLLAVVLLAVFVGLSVYVSGPVTRALGELLNVVKQLSKGQGSSAVVESELADVDQIGRELARVIAQVEDGQNRLARAKKELKATQKEMDEYTYVISHDLKEPLRGIEAFSKFLADGYRHKLDEDGQHHVDVIRQSVLRMQRLITDLLHFSRMSQQKSQMTPVGLNTMLMHVRVRLQHALDAKHVDLRVDKLPMVVCDATAMTEVFHNLITNAIKYNDKPLPVIEIGCEEKSNPATKQVEYVFHVRDNGIGIKQEYFAKIFQIFQRLQRDEEGTGIGLTIVKRVIESHGGRIWLESAEGKGTTFFFTLPKRETTKTGTIIEGPTKTKAGDSTIEPTV